MAVLPARPFILRVSYPTLVSTLTPSNLPVSGDSCDAANDLDEQSSIQFDISLGFTLSIPLTVSFLCG